MFTEFGLLFAECPGSDLEKASSSVNMPSGEDDIMPEPDAGSAPEESLKANSNDFIQSVAAIVKERVSGARSSSRLSSSSATIAGFKDHKPNVELKDTSNDNEPDIKYVPKSQSAQSELMPLDTDALSAISAASSDRLDEVGEPDSDANVTPLNSAQSSVASSKKKPKKVRKIAKPKWKKKKLAKPAKIEEEPVEEEYVVEKIVDKKIENGVPLWFIKWKDWDS